MPTAPRPRGDWWLRRAGAAFGALAIMLPAAVAAAGPPPPVGPGGGPGGPGAPGGGPGRPGGPPAPPAANCGTAIVKSDGTAWTCTFADDFTGPTLDPAKWTVLRTADQGFHSGAECFVNSPNNVSVAGGYLNLTVRKEVAPFNCASGWGTSYSTQYTGAMVTTTGRFAQTYGRFAVRARFPAATVAGLQSMLWMWPQNLSATGLAGEIDIAEEYSSYADRAIPTLHYAYDPATTNYATNTNVVTNYFCTISDVSAFHEYAVEWTSTTITVRYDNQTCIVDRLAPSGTSPFDQPYYLLLTQALGIGDNAYVDGAAPLPATTQVDWVRAWK